MKPKFSCRLRDLLPLKIVRGLYHLVCSVPELYYYIQSLRAEREAEKQAEIEEEERRRLRQEQEVFIL